MTVLMPTVELWVRKWNLNIMEVNLFMEVCFWLDTRYIKINKQRQARDSEYGNW